jgi:predicted transposase YbfD/YdcC
MRTKKDLVDEFELIFAGLPDPRVERTRRHPLMSVLMLALVSMISGCEGWDEMARFCAIREEWLKTWIDLPNGTPCADTFRRVFMALDTRVLHGCFVQWMAAIGGRPDGKLIAIDGKTMRGTLAKALGKTALHLVSAWVPDDGIVLGQVITAEKSNEITAIPELLELIAVKGATVTIDAMGCQTKIADLIISKGAHYILALKGNQSTLADDVKLFFEEAKRTKFADIKHLFHETVDADHGRVEVRKIWTTTDIEWMVDAKKNWKGLGALICIESEHTKAGVVTTESRHYITSHSDKSAEELGARVRAHWGIENGLHWTLDTTFHEDACRIRNGAENFALLRKLALILFKQEKSLKTSVRQKKKAAGWDQDYALRVMTAGFPAD